MTTEKIVDEGSVDRYDFIKNSYEQNRDYLIHDGNLPEDTDPTCLTRALKQLMSTLQEKVLQNQHLLIKVLTASINPVFQNHPPQIKNLPTFWNYPNQSK